MPSVLTAVGTYSSLWNSWLTAQNTTATWPAWSSTGCISTLGTWGAWNQALPVYTTGTNGLWGAWNLTLSSPTIIGNSVNGTWTAPVLTDEERTRRQVAYERQQAEYRARQECQRREMVEARQRARRLLLRCLNWRQRQQLRQHRYFHVRSQRGRRYRVREGQAGNVTLLDSKGNELRRYCIHPREFVPDEDAMLAQKLMLETDEDAFEQVANVTHLRMVA